MIDFCINCTVCIDYKTIVKGGGFCPICGRNYYIRNAISVPTMPGRHTTPLCPDFKLTILQGVVYDHN